MSDNVVAIPDVVEVAKDADILIFVLPHQFMTNTCKPLVGKIKSNAFGVSLCKVKKHMIFVIYFFIFIYLCKHIRVFM